MYYRRRVGGLCWVRWTMRVGRVSKPRSCNPLFNIWRGGGPQMHTLLKLNWSSAVKQDWLPCCHHLSGTWRGRKDSRLHPHAKWLQVQPFPFLAWFWASKWLAPRPTPCPPFACCGQEDSWCWEGISGEVTGSPGTLWWPRDTEGCTLPCLSGHPSSQWILRSSVFTGSGGEAGSVSAEIPPTLPGSQTPGYTFCVAFAAWGNAPHTLWWRRQQKEKYYCPRFPLKDRDKEQRERQGLRGDTPPILIVAASG